MKAKNKRLIRHIFQDILWAITLLLTIFVFEGEIQFVSAIILTLTGIAFVGNLRNKMHNKE